MLVDQSLAILINLEVLYWVCHFVLSKLDDLGEERPQWGDREQQSRMSSLCSLCRSRRSLPYDSVGEFYWMPSILTVNDYCVWGSCDKGFISGVWGFDPNRFSTNVIPACPIPIPRPVWSMSRHAL